MDKIKKVSYITAYKDPPSKDINNSRLQKNNIVGETIWSIINESVAFVFDKLHTARHADSTWIPKIILNIPNPPYVSNLLSPSTTPINTTDIVPFLQIPSVQLGIILKNELNYPGHCNLCLEGYNGKDDSDKLDGSIIAAASKMEHL